MSQEDHTSLYQRFRVRSKILLRDISGVDVGVAAFGEELGYRGYLMNRVAELGGSRTAWAVSLVVVSVVFGVAHLPQGMAGVLVNIATGLVFGALYLWSGRNLWAPIIAHGVYDTVALLLIFWGKYPGL